MTVLLLAYDLELEATRTKVLQFLDDEYRDRVRLSESSWAIWTDDEWPAQLFPHLEARVGKDDQLYLITLVEGWEAKAPKEIEEWLLKKLSEPLPNASQLPPQQR